MPVVGRSGVSDAPTTATRRGAKKRPKSTGRNSSGRPDTSRGPGGPLRCWSTTGRRLSDAVVSNVGGQRRLRRTRRTQVRSVRVGILSREFFDRALGRMGGFGFAARAVAATLDDLRPQVEPVLLSGTAPGPDGL